MLPKKGPITAKSVNPIFVDSSAWIALFSARDQNHASADQLFRDAINSKRILLTSNLVIAEVHRLLLHRAGERAAMAVLERIESSGNVKILFEEGAHHLAAIKWMQQLAGIPVTYADAIGFSLMESECCKDFIGYDQHFCAAGFNSLR
jgi:uncharacterized protein